METYEHVHFKKTSTHSTSSNSSHDDLLSSSPLPSTQILHSVILPIQTLNDNDTYIISDNNNVQDIIKQYVKN